MSLYDDLRSQIGQNHQPDQKQQPPFRNPRIFIDAYGDDYQKAVELGAKWDWRHKCLYVMGKELPSDFEKWRAQPIPSAKEQLSDFLKENGLIINGKIHFDDKWHHVPVDEGSKKLSGSYKAELIGDRIRAVLENHKYGDGAVTFISKRPSRAYVLNMGKTPQKPQPKPEIKSPSIPATQSSSTQEDGYKQAAKTAYGVWKNTPAWANAKNAPYLDAKKQRGYGVRASEDGSLVVPMRNHKGKIQSVQFIRPDGTKMFLKGGKKAGAFHVIDPKKELELSERIAFVEGYSNGATVYQALDCPTIVCFDKGNMVTVAKAFHERFPEKQKIIAGDNDHVTALKYPQKGNPGLKAATEAAEAVDGVEMCPQFTPEQMQKGYSDWDDMRLNAGLKSVRDQMEARLPEKLICRQMEHLNEKHSLSARSTRDTRPSIMP